LSPTRPGGDKVLGSVDSCSSSDDLQIPEWHVNLWQKRPNQQSRLTQLFRVSTNAAQPEQAPGQGKYELLPEAKDKFFFADFEAEITFVRDETDKVTQLILHQRGDHPAKKVK
jgi:hypothetical protein